MIYTAGEIAQITSGQTFGDADHPVSRILLDTRKVRDAADAVFFAINGDVHDGHQFIQSAVDQGVKVIVCERDPTIEGVTTIKVRNSLSALQKLAASHRSKFDIPVVGITGSNGKTVVKEWLTQLLAPDKIICRSPKSYNSQVGVPLSVWNLDSRHNLAIFEAGISKPGEMKRLEPMVKPTIGIFTNVGQAHMENFDSKEQLAHEKAALFASADRIIFRSDYPEIIDALSTFGGRMIRWGKTEADSYRVELVHRDSHSIQVNLSWNGDSASFQLPFGDDASYENAIHCVVFMLEQGYEPAIINQRLALLQSVDMRLELLQGKRNCTVVSDVYSADLNSLEIALDFFAHQQSHDRRVVIISELVESGLSSEQWIAHLSELLQNARVDELLFVGDDIRAQSGLPQTTTIFSSTDELISHLQKNALSNADILVKGARKHAFEKVSKLLEMGVNGTYLEINLDALRENLNHFRGALDPGVKLMVMVKAFAYGSGAHEISRILEFNQVDALGVAFTDEGVALRESGVSLPILVLNPEVSGFETLIHYRLEPELFSLTQLEDFAQAVKNAGESNYAVHIKINTGMNRLGLDEGDINALVSKLNEHPEIRVSSLFSHLAASEDSQHDDFTSEQIAKFEALSERIQASLSYEVDRHILNTSGVDRFPKAQFDMVRLGIGLYGANPGPGVRPVASLKSNLSQIRSIQAGESVGYSRAYVAQENSVIGTIPIGYADGIDRRMGNGTGRMYVNGSFVPIIGNVCMDMCMVDLTGIECAENDPVEIFGEHISVAEVAEAMGTINYEVITGISLRVRRVFVQD